MVILDLKIFKCLLPSMCVNIQQLVSLTRSRIKALELFFVLEGKKKVARQLYTHDQFSKIETFCHLQQLYLVKSPKKIALLDTHEAFSNTGTFTTSPDGLYLVYISKDEHDAHMACLCELREQHTLLGELLGYPVCCIKYFLTHFSAKSTDLSLPSKYWQLNVLQRKNDYSLIFHFPCSGECLVSLGQAKTDFELLEKKERSFAEELQKHLQIL